MDDKLLHILQHSLGLDQYGRGSRYRNHFCTGPGSKDFDMCRDLVARGFMVDHGKRALAGGDHLFSVTPEGDETVREHSPKPQKLTRSQKRYRDYLEVSDCYENFHHYLVRTAYAKRMGLPR